MLIELNLDILVNFCFKRHIWVVQELLLVRVLPNRKVPNLDVAKCDSCRKIIGCRIRWHLAIVLGF